MKAVLIVFALWLYGAREFAYIYIGERILLFDIILSYFRFKKIMSFIWYIENHIVVRAMQFIKRRFI